MNDKHNTPIQGKNCTRNRRDNYVNKPDLLNPFIIQRSSKYTLVKLHSKRGPPPPATEMVNEPSAADDVYIVVGHKKQIRKEAPKGTGIK